MGKINQVDFNKYIKKAYIACLNNQDLCKLLYYNESNPLEQKDIEDVSILRTGEDKKIYLSPFIPTTDTEKTCLSIFLDNSRPYQNNSRCYNDVYVGFYICSHLNLWELDDNIRVLSIVNILDSIFNDKRELDGISRDSMREVNFANFNENFKGYYISYKITDFA